MGSLQGSVVGCPSFCMGVLEEGGIRRGEKKGGDLSLLKAAKAREHSLWGGGLPHRATPFVLY